ncbi:inositol phosphorylceramide synthase [Paenibacillus donghaensis]|uniref:phosphatase PAP2 family protein n=1 Tax=Paenibacillus donghaensis TaxID=414771 RepID=UPI00188416E7|nr:phosphatase PAP2 family protein [Paenibacillus donghaensis]MBE9916377.1 inositol phosphorylceramide synthase [Paenibacillus donghaensis]
MKTKLAPYLPLAWLLSIPVLNICYGFLNRGGSDTAQLITAWDRLIPFMPAFIIPYLIWYPYVFLMFVVFFRKDRNVYYRSLTLTCVGLAVCYLVFYLYQTTFPRPEIGQDGVLNWLVGIVYQMDAPYNCFPSIHVLTSYIVVKAAYQCKLSRLANAAVCATSGIIIISTLFVKQHVLMDVVGGIVLAEMLYFWIGRKIFKPGREKRAAHGL